ncbi:MAG: PAS domain S-box protein [Spirochaetales bacterium]|nr:PAS domain S-box protein [Spirochaetales bacterium]
MGGVYIWNGILFLKFDSKKKFVRRLLFITFFVWGVHKLDYPFVQSVAWFSPWGYLLASLCGIIIAIGIILIYYEQARMVLRERKNLLAEAQKIARIGNYTWDVGNDLNYWSDEMKQILGCEGLEASYKLLLSIIHPDDLERVIEKGEEARNNLHELNLDYRVIRPDGKLCYIHDQARVEQHKDGKFMLGTIQDITERKLNENEIGNLKNFYENILESVEDGIWVTNFDDVIYYTNKAMEKIAGIEREKIIGNHVINDFPEETLKDFIPYYEQAKNQLIPVFYEVYVKTPALRDSHQTGWLIPLIEDRKYNGMICTIQDTTERKKMEENIKQSLKEKEILMREINHRVKNNLNVILSLLNFQKENTARLLLDKSTQQIINYQFSKIQNRIFSIALTHQLLYKAHDISKIDFKKYLESLINYLMNSCGQKEADTELYYKLTNQYPFDLDMVKTLGLIINELITNSIKYASDSGKKLKIIVELNQIGNVYFLTIKDNGPGIRESYLNEKVETSGLFLVQILSEEIRGEIDFQNQNGLTVKLEFKTE